jgi:hypothetical protein
MEAPGTAPAQGTAPAAAPGPAGPVPVQNAYVPDLMRCPKGHTFRSGLHGTRCPYCIQGALGWIRSRGRPGGGMPGTGGRFGFPGFPGIR